MRIVRTFSSHLLFTSSPPYGRLRGALIQQVLLNFNLLAIIIIIPKQRMVAVITNALAVAFCHRRVRWRHLPVLFVCCVNRQALYRAGLWAEGYGRETADCKQGSHVGFAARRTVSISSESLRCISWWSHRRRYGYHALRSL